MLMMLAITDVTLTSVYNMAEGVDERLSCIEGYVNRSLHLKPNKTITSFRK